MKKYVFLLIYYVSAFAMNAQQSGSNQYVGFNIGTGLGTMNFSPQKGEHGSGMGFNVGFSYTYFFTEQYGLRVGMGYTMSNATSLYDFTEITPGLSHADNPNVVYDLYTRFNGWKEHQTLGFFSIPIEFCWRMPVYDDWSFILGVGAIVDVNIHGKYSVNEGSFSTEGYFPVIGHLVANQPEHGFVTSDADFTSDIPSLAPCFSLIAETGVQMPLNDYLGLYVGLFGSYGLNNLAPENGNPLLCINPENATQLDYYGTLASNEISSLHALHLGIKIGINMYWDSYVKKPSTHTNYPPAPRMENPTPLPHNTGNDTEQPNADEQKMNELQEFKDKNNALQKEIAKLEENIATQLNDIRKPYETADLDYLYEHISLDEVNLHKELLGNTVPAINELLILFDCAEALKHPFNEKRNEECLRRLKNVRSCKTKDELSDWLSVQKEIGEEVQAWIKGDDNSFYSYVFFVKYIFGEYGVDFEKGYPYLLKQIRSAIK